MSSITPTTASIILETYRNGSTIQEAAIAANTSLTTAYNHITTSGIKRTPKRTKTLRYNVDETFFKTIDTELKAYWLGFLYADGCIPQTKDSITITLAAKDYLHVKAFAEALQYNGPIKRYWTKDRPLASGKILKATECVRINICRSSMVQDLVRLGCVPAKSLILTFPTPEQVPSHLLKHFIRGYFDGDGCISKTMIKGRLQYSVNMLGTHNMLKGISDWLSNNGVSLTKIYPNRKGRPVQSFSHGGNNKVIAIYRALYDTATIFLSRKHSLFRDCLEAKGGFRGLPPCIVRDPNGKSVHINEYKEFCRTNHLSISSMRRMLKGERPQYKGYTLIGFQPTPENFFTPHIRHKARTPKRYLFTKDEKEITIENLSAYARENGLSYECFGQVCRGKKPSYKGYRFIKYLE